MNYLICTYCCFYKDMPFPYRVLLEIRFKGEECKLGHNLQNFRHFRFLDISTNNYRIEKYIK